MTKFYTNVYQGRGCYHLCGYEDGKKFHRRAKYTPFLFVTAEPGSKSPYKTIKGQVVERKDFDSTSEARKFVQDFGNVGGFNVFGSDRFLYNFINDEFEGKIDYDYELIRVATIDIEVGSDETTGFPDPFKADQEITAITIFFAGSYFVFGCGEYEATDKDVRYTRCRDERDLLNKFLRFWRSLDIDILTGWYVAGFDVPYLYNRYLGLFGEEIANSLSPWDKVDVNEFTSFGRSTKEYIIAGITVLDYMDLYKKHSYTPQENYKLETIAQHELGYGKLQYKGSLLGLWKNDYQKFIDYNIRDVRIVVGLDEKMKFIELVAAMAYDAKVNYQDTFTTVKIWDVIIHNYLLDRYIVVPMSVHHSEDRQILGGYVKETRPNLYRWVVSFDFASLYPSLIQQYNISPDTFVDRVEGITPETILDNRHLPVLEECKERNLSLCAIGTRFRRDKTGFLSELMAEKFAKRSEYKKLMLEWEQEKERLERIIKEHGETDERTKELKVCTNNVAKFNNFQQVIKIQLNSAFGALANPGFRYFASDMAESITVSGQMTTQYAERKLNEFLNKACGTNNVDYVIAADTDSNYITLDGLVKKFCKPDWDNKRIAKWLDDLCQRAIQPYLAKCFTQLCESVNAHRDGIIVMKRENIGDIAIFIAKKRYIMNSLTKENVFYDEPKLKVVGIEAVRSSTPVIVKEYIKNAMKIVMKEDKKELYRYIDTVRTEFFSSPFGGVAKPTGVKGLRDYADKNTIYKVGKATPIHVRGSLLYNHFVEKNNLGNKYTLIQDGDKVKFTYLKMPNPIFENVIACPLDDLPEELGLDPYINYELQFTKTFLDPIDNIINIIGWDSEQKASLEDFFS